MRTKNSTPNPCRIEGDTAILSLQNNAKVIVAETIIDLADLERVQEVGRWCGTWKADIQNYYVRGRGGRLRLHRFLLDAPPDLHVDHINRNPLDNRRQNLRLATPLQNAQNRGTSAATVELGSVSVTWYPCKRRYLVYVRRAEGRKRIGQYETRRVAEMVARLAPLLT